MGEITARYPVVGVSFKGAGAEGFQGSRGLGPTAASITSTRAA